ncbi:hypothetical protein Tco_0724791 [Tanacetum coccineum]|uniref:Uncharacterized protein n=1 Tax=Tanacetum coccineum TaxID=301880 RepID=A0ABQ4YB32_9ASTR
MVSEYGNSFKLVARTTKNADGTSTLTILRPVTTEEKAQKKTDVKARSMNKPDMGTISFDDLYNNFKIVEQEVKRSVTSSSNSSSQNVAFVSTPGSTNEDNTANVQVSTTSTNVSTASTNNSTASLNQMHEDDLEEIDLKWQLALLSLKERKFYQRTGKKIIINGSDTVDYDKSKVECFNYTSSKAMVAFDGAGFDWSFMADEEVPTNLELMAFSDSEIEKLKKEKESNQIKIDNFENASKSLDKLIRSQIVDKSRKGVGFENYNAVAPPPTGLFAPLTIDLSSSGLKEFQQPEFESYGVNIKKSVSENSSNEIKKTTGAPIIEDWVFNCDEIETEVMVSDNVQHKPEQAKQSRKITEKPKNNRTNWNEKKTQKLGVAFQFTKKACFVCGSFNHLIKDCDFHDKKDGTKTCDEQLVLTKSGIVPISTARQSSSRAAAPLSAARPINTAAPKPFVDVAKTKPNVIQKEHSLSRRPFNQQTALNNRILNNKVNTAKVNSINTTKGKRVTSDVGE